MNKKREFYGLNSSLSFSEGDVVLEDEIRKNSGRSYRHIQKKFNQIKSVIAHSSDRKDSLDIEKKEKLRSLGYVDFK